MDLAARVKCDAAAQVRRLQHRIDCVEQGSPMQRIAFISEHASPLALPGGTDSGGQNVYVAHLARELARLGCLVDVYTRREDPLQPQVIEWRAGVRVIHVDAGPPCVVSKESLLPYMADFGHAMLRFMRATGVSYQLAHANFFMSGMVAQQLKRLTGLPYVITFHALGRVRRLCQGQADGFPDARFVIEESLMRDADCVIAECEQDQRDMLELYDGAPARLAIVPCGFDPDEFWPVRDTARTRLGLPEREFIVLQLGRIVPRKGVDNVLQAMAVLRDAHGVSGELLVVGGEAARADPMASAEIRRLAGIAHRLGLGEQVRFTGAQPRQRLREYYSAADVFVTTPWYEPFGITPLEAMACATPVIGSAVGGIRSTVLHQKTGFLVPPHDPEALAQRLAQLQRDPALAERMGWTGLRRAQRHFTWERVALQLNAIYRAVLARQPKPEALRPLSVGGEPSGLVQ